MTQSEMNSNSFDDAVHCDAEMSKALDGAKRVFGGQAEISRMISDSQEAFVRYRALHMILLKGLSQGSDQPLLKNAAYQLLTEQRRDALLGMILDSKPDEVGYVIGGFPNP